MKKRRAKKGTTLADQSTTPDAAKPSRVAHHHPRRLASFTYQPGCRGNWAKASPSNRLGLLVSRFKRWTPRARRLLPRETRTAHDPNSALVYSLSTSIVLKGWNFPLVFRSHPLFRPLWQAPKLRRPSASLLRVSRNRGWLSREAIRTVCRGLGVGGCHTSSWNSRSTRSY